VKRLKKNNEGNDNEEKKRGKGTGRGRKCSAKAGGGGGFEGIVRIQGDRNPHYQSESPQVTAERSSDSTSPSHRISREQERNVEGRKDGGKRGDLKKLIYFRACDVGIRDGKSERGETDVTEGRRRKTTLGEGCTEVCQEGQLGYFLLIQGGL